MKLKKAMVSVLAMLLVVALLAGCSSSGKGVKIGVLAPLTGEVSVYGTAVEKGVKLAVKEINAAGGVLDQDIVLEILDEKGDIAEASTAYDKLVSAKIVALIGDVTSKPCMAVAEKAAKDNMPMITGTGTAANITEVGENVFRACFIDPFQGEVMANYAATELGVKKAAILYDIANDYSVGLTDSFTATAKEKGVEIVASEGYTGGALNLS